MNETTDVTTEEHSTKAWYRHEMVLFIFGSLVVAFMLVSLGLSMYVSSGADLLDLSRPGYKTVRGEVEPTGTFQSFSANGPVTKDTINEFLELYDRQTRPVINDDVFNVSTLEDQTLGIDAPTAGE